MKVTLLSYTQHAAELMIFTKQTRLNMTPGLMEEIKTWDAARIAEELIYMSHTIPSSWEFCDYVFLVEGVSRAYTHQQVRTRSASYAQQSLRVVEACDFDYVYSSRVDEGEPREVIDWVLSTIKNGYRQLRALGVPPEDARGILPTNIATNIVCKFNLRSFCDLARSREGGRTQEEYRTVVTEMINCVLDVHPWVEHFLWGNVGRDYFEEIERFADRHFGHNLIQKGELLKIVDAMRKELK